MSTLIDTFISGFEEKFGQYLQPAIHLNAQGGQIISHTKHFSVIHPVLKFSDWDLECRVVPDNVNHTVLREMYEYIHGFSGFKNIGDFVGNGLFQIMAFLPREEIGPFIDIHIQGMEGDLRGRYFEEILDYSKAREQTIDWLVITWFRKMKNGSVEANHFREGWLKEYLTPEQYEQSGKDPYVFFLGYFKDRRYGEILDYLK